MSAIAPGARSAGRVDSSAISSSWYREDTGVVLQHGDDGLAAAERFSRDPRATAGRTTCDARRRSRRTALDGTAGLGIAMGALPFEGSCEAVLRLPERVIRAAPLHGEIAPQPGGRSRRSYPNRCRSSTKPRLSARSRRSTRARSRRWFSPEPCWWRRTRRSTRACSRGASTPEEPGRFVFLVALPGGTSNLVGASPELVIRRKGRKVFSDPLAGTARRSQDRTRDREIARQLLDAVKEQREHRLVAEAVADALTPFCSNLVVDGEAEPDVDGNALASPHSDQGDAQARTRPMH